MNTVLFCFAGRRENLELQLPLVEWLLARHRWLRYEVWNLARTPRDAEFVRAIGGDRVVVRNDFYGVPARSAMNRVYRHYSSPRYQYTRFVKVDDDVVFFQVDRFVDFVAAIRPNRVVSAKVINNGACSRIDHDLWTVFEGLTDRVIGSVSPHEPLLDVHLSREYAQACHQHMFDHWRRLVGEPLRVIPTEDWLSINLVGYDWRTGRRIAKQVGGRHQTDVRIAGRPYRRGTRLGDEGMVNTLPRFVVQGFLACHLGFGPQKPSPQQLEDWRRAYRRIGECYLRMSR